jgi:uncharacterized protein (TIGR02118 family)
MLQPALEFVAIGDDVDAVRSVAEIVGGHIYFDDRRDAKGLPFRTLIRAVTDRPALLEAASSVGTYVVCVRPKRVRSAAPPSTAVIQVNAMVANPDIGVLAADTHWRDTHAPLALTHHIGMTQYTQLSVVHRISGPEYNGFALCEFDSMDDLREKFFDGPEGERVIYADIAKFADRERSPRRLLARRP